MRSVGFIGSGAIASAMVMGLLGRGLEINVSNRNKVVAKRLAQNKGVRVLENQQVLDSSDIVFLCLMADVAKTVLPELEFNKQAKVVSVMTDVTLSDLKTICAPATDISITIPLPSVAKGGCLLPCFPSVEAVESVFGFQNPCFAVQSESALNAHFAATAFASVSFAQALAVKTWLAKHTGNNVEAEKYVIGMMAGFYQALQGEEYSELTNALEELSTEGGLNQFLKSHMANLGAEDHIREGLELLEKRLALEDGKVN